MQKRAIAAVRASAATALAAAPDYPDVVGDIRILRFLKGFQVRHTSRPRGGIAAHNVGCAVEHL